jgi:tetratricopeptide (TPR) repeat protein
MRIIVLAFCLLVLLANGAFANFAHKDVPADSNAIAFDQRLLLRQAHEGYVWPDAIYSQQQINAQPSNTIRDAWIAHNLSFTLKAFPRENNNFLLPLLNRGLLNYSTGNHDKAYRYLVNAQQSMDDLKQKSITLAGERAKIFKGEQYERAMASFYLGLMLYEKGDYENARAMFSNTIECDRETVPVQKDLDKLAKKYTKKKPGGSEQEFVNIYKTLANDNRLAYYMLARTYKKLDQHRDSQISLNNTGNWLDVPAFIKEESCGVNTVAINSFDTPPPSDNPYTAEARLEEDNLVMLIQMGFAPEKQASGWEGRKDVLAPRHYPERKAVVYIDGKRLGQAYPIFNLMHQATPTVRTIKDTAQTGKAAGKFLVSIFAAVVDSYAGSDLQSVVQDKWSVAADTRRWGSLPNEFHLISAQVEPGLHTINVLFYDQSGNPLPHYEQTHYFIPTKKDKETFLVLRSLRDKSNTVRDFYGSKMQSYNEKKNEIVFNAGDLAGLQAGHNLDIITIDFGDEKLNQQFMQEGVVIPGFTKISRLQQNFDKKYKQSTITRVGVARVDQVNRSKAVCKLVEGNLDPKKTYFITNYKLPLSVIKDETNFDVLPKGI